MCCNILLKFSLLCMFYFETELHKGKKGLARFGAKNRSPSVTYIPSIVCKLVTTMIHVSNGLQCNCRLVKQSQPAVRQLTRGLENLFTSIGWQLATGRWHSVKLQTKNSLFAAFFKENDSSLSPLCFHLLPMFQLGHKQNFFYRANIEMTELGFSL